MELESLNKTHDVSLISSTDSSPLCNDSEIEIVPDTTTTKCHLTLLQIPSGTNQSENGVMYLSSHSNASTNNTDICVIDESHYGGPNDQQRHCFQHMERSIDAPDFTVLHAPGTQNRFRDLCHFEESTEVLDMMSSECTRKSSNPCSGTDSDVEVLMTEDVGDSDWSAGVAGSMDELERTPQNMELQSDERAMAENAQTAITNHSLASVTTTTSVQHQESTDHDISIEEFSHSSAEGSYDHLNRSQLLDLVNEQAAHIRRQDKKLERYRNAQQKLFQHIEKFRQECALSPVKTLDGSHVQYIP